ncbi:MAG: hypothetical protein ACI4L6_01975 [Candidatus Onthoplasma sp.]
MREIALASQVKNKHILDYLHTNIKSQIDFCKTIVTSYCDNNFCYLLFACVDEYVMACEKILRDIIIDYIENVYKIDYLKEKIKNPLKENFEFNAYVKVLSIFDKSTDENALEKIIIFNQTFFVDSFLEFRLAPLKKHWDNLAELSCENIAMFSSTTFLDVIKYLINTMDNEVYKVKVICAKNKFSVYNMQNKNAKVKKIAECQDEYDLIAKVLNKCPSYIDVYINTENNCEAVSFLSSVYSNRLKIFTKK